MLTWIHARHLSLTAVEPQVTADTLPPLSSDFELQSRGALSIDWSWVSARLRFKASSWTWGDSKNVKCSQTTPGMTARPYDERPVEASHPSVCAWGGSGEVSASSYLKKKISFYLFASCPSPKVHRPLPVAPRSIITCLSWPCISISFFYSHYCSLLYGGDDTSPARLPQLPHPSDPAATSLLPRSTRPL